MKGEARGGGEGGWWGGRGRERTDPQQKKLSSKTTALLGLNTSQVRVILALLMTFPLFLLIKLILKS